MTPKKSPKTQQNHQNKTNNPQKQPDECHNPMYNPPIKSAWHSQTLPIVLKLPLREVNILY